MEEIEHIAPSTWTLFNIRTSSATTVFKPQLHSSRNGLGNFTRCTLLHSVFSDIRRLLPQAVVYRQHQPFCPNVLHLNSFTLISVTVLINQRVKGVSGSYATLIRRCRLSNGKPDGKIVGRAFFSWRQLSLPPPPSPSPSFIFPLRQTPWLSPSLCIADPGKTEWRILHFRLERQAIGHSYGALLFEGGRKCEPGTSSQAASWAKLCDRLDQALIFEWQCGKVLRKTLSTSLLRNA